MTLLDPRVLKRIDKITSNGPVGYVIKQVLKIEAEKTKILIDALEFQCGVGCCADQNPCNAKQALSEYFGRGDV